MHRLVAQRGLKVTLLALLVAAGFSSACGKTHLADEGGETHFLIKCESDDTCEAIDSDLRCSDGYCRSSTDDVSNSDIPNNPDNNEADASVGLPPNENSPSDLGSATGSADDTLVPSDKPDTNENSDTGENEEMPPSGDDPGSDPSTNLPSGNTSGSSSLKATDSFTGSFAHVEIFGENESSIGGGNAIVGDLDGDGYDEVVVVDSGRPPGSGLIGVSGAAYLFYGRAQFPTRLDPGSADLILRGASAGVAGLGDINGDGYDDFAIPIVCRYEYGCTVANGLQIIYGGATRHTGDMRADQLGIIWRYVDSTKYYEVSSAGDVNGDGYADALVDTMTSSGATATHLLLGRATPLNQALPNGTSDAVFTGVRGGSFGPGDLDGDGYDEIVVPAGPDDNLNRHALFYGGSTAFSGTIAGDDADAIVSSQPNPAAMRPIGDLDGDGCDEWPLPSYGASGLDGPVSVVAVAYGRTNRFGGSYWLDSIADFTIRTTNTLNGLGASDLDGDGWLDLLIGDANDQTVAYRSGALSAVRGAADRLQGELIVNSSNGVLFGQVRFDHNGGDYRDYLGWGTAGGGDVNGDGFQDALVGATGNDRTFLVLGSSGTGESCIDDSQCGDCRRCQIAGGATQGVCAQAPEGAACGDTSASECDDPDSCDAAGACMINRKALGAACGHEADSCSEGYCDGVLAVCPRKTTAECLPCTPTVIQRAGVVASSSLGANVAANAIDSSTGTRWESHQAVDPQWIYVDLGADVAVETVVITWETASAADYVIQLAADGTCAGPGAGCLGTNDPWVTAYTSPHYTQTKRVDTASLTGTGRYVRIFGTARTTAYGYSIFNMMILGNSPSVCEPTVNCGDDVECGPCHVCNEGACVQLPAGVACGSSFDSECDNSDTCDEVGVCQRNVEPTKTPCAGDGNACTLDICDGLQPFCPYEQAVECGGCVSSKLTPVTAVASSSSAGHDAGLVIDENSTSYWRSTPGDDSEFIYLDFGADVFMREITINWSTESARRYRMEMAVDGNPIVWSQFFGGDNPVLDRTETWTISKVGRYVRMMGTQRNTSGAYTIEDFSVFGDTNASCQ